MINLKPYVPTLKFPEVKTDFIALCEKLLKDPFIRSLPSIVEEIELCKKEWKEGKLRREGTEVDYEFFHEGEFETNPDVLRIRKDIGTLGDCHRLRAKDRVWYKFAI